MGDTYYYVRKEKILIGNSNADICIPDMEKEYLVTEKEIDAGYDTAACNAGRYHLYECISEAGTLCNCKYLHNDCDYYFFCSEVL